MSLGSLTRELRHRLESYLCNEGLAQALPQFARARLAREHPWQRYWLILSGASGLLVMLGLAVFSSISILDIAIATLVPPVVSLVLFHILDLVQWKWQFPTRRWTIRAWMLGSATLSAGLCLWVSKSAYVGLSYIGLTAVSYKLLNLLIPGLESAIQLSDFISGLARALRRSIAALAQIFFLLAVLVLLSTFSGELWQSVGTLAWQQWGMAMALVMLLVLLLLLARWKPLLDSLGGSRSSLESKQVLRGVLEVSLSSDSEQITKNVFRIPKIEDLGQKQLRDSLRAQLAWRDLDCVRCRLVSHLRRAWRFRVLGRLFSTGTMLAIALLVVLGALFWIVFYPSDFFLDNITNLTPRSASVILTKVVLFLAAILAAQFVARVLTDHELQVDVFGDLDKTVMVWADAMTSCLALLRSGYELPTEYCHENLDISRIDIVVPADASRSHVRQVCQCIVERAEDGSHSLLVTAFAQHKSGAYDVSMPGKRWHILAKRHNIVSLEELSSNDEDLLHQHAMGLEWLNSGTELDPRWFGDGGGEHAGQFLWSSDSEHTWIYHPYAYEACGVLWVLLRVQSTDLDTVLGERAAERALGTLRETYLHDLPPKAVAILVYGREDTQPCGHLLWRPDQPELVSWVDGPSTSCYA